MERNDQNLLLNIRKADTDDLLDRVTAFRAGMEADALAMIEDELGQRGVDAGQIAEHDRTCRQACLFYSDGTAKMCSLCRKPAVQEGWRWHRLLKVLPLFPRWMRFCQAHAASAQNLT